MIGTGKNKDFGLNIITKVIDIKNDEEDDEIDTSTKIHGDVYTEDALILQSILEYSKKIGTEPFTDRSITEYLVNPNESRCKVFVDLYSGDNGKTNNGSRITKNLDRINNTLGNLEYLDLVISEQGDTKTDIQVHQYRFTKLGKIIGLLLLYEKGKIKDNKELMKSLIDFYSSMNNSWSFFYVIFLRKSIDIPKVFERAILFHIESLKNADSNKDVSIEQFIKVPVILDKNYWKIFNESLDFLENIHTGNYNFLVYVLQLLVEEQQESTCSSFRGFEEARYTIRSLPYQVTIEGHCNFCKLYVYPGANVRDHLNSYINSDPSNRHNRFDVSCPLCHRGNLYFDTIKVKTISGNPVLDKKNRRKKFDLFVSEDNVDIHKTIFNTSKRSKRYQAILRFLFDKYKPKDFFTTTDLMNEILKIEPEIFGVNEKLKSNPTTTYYYQFESYLGALATCGLIIIEKLPNKKNKSSMVDGYQLSDIAGKTFALISKWHINDDNNKEKLYDEIYQCWLPSFDDSPISSLDLFCKSYLYECKEQGLFDVFVQAFSRYLNNNHHTYNNVDIFTYILLSKFDDWNNGNKENRLKNEKLWTLWLETYLKLDEHNEMLLLTHIQIHLTRRIGRKIHDLGDYEIERYIHKNESNQLTIEAKCLNCNSEYLYLTVPVIIYIQFSFGCNSDKIKNVFSEQIVCEKCKKNNFDFIMV